MRTRWRSLGLLLALIGPLALPAAHAGDLPPGIDLPYQGSGSLPLGIQTLQLQGQRLLSPTGAVLADRLYTAAVSDGQHLCAADEGLDGLGQLRCWNVQLHAITLTVGGRPGRLTLNQGMVAWVASPHGLPQVFVSSVTGSSPPRALTNVGLQRQPGQAPAGFVPPPLGSTLRFDGDWLRWTTAEGPRAVRWR